MNASANCLWRRMVSWSCLAILTPLALVAAAVDSPDQSAEDTVVLLSVQGKVEVARAGTENWAPARANQVLQPGDKLRTGKSSRATIRSSKWGQLRVRESGLIIIEPPRASGQRPLLNLIKGFFYFFNRDKAIEVDLQNRLASAATRGTEFQVAVSETGRMEVAVFDGEVDLRNDSGVVTVASGQQGVAVTGQAPTRTLVPATLSVIQWCLYYPAVLEVDELGLGEGEKETLRESVAAWRSGDLLKALNSYPEDRQPASEAERVYRAALLLVVGETAQAEALLPSTGAAAPLADALKQSIAAVQFRDCDRRVPPALASEWLAESYCRQSRASADPQMLERALEAAEAAVAKAPDSGLAWARLAELQFSFGRTHKALAALENALRLSPRNAQALALKGFLLSAENKVPQAIEFFDQAIAADGALADGWLGRGLCRIRQGHAAEGRADLLTAAALEPQRAVLRSYLGKAFSDAGDDRRARQELDLARKLDPRDPTSWLYSALENQRQNRVNEAVRDLEKSKTLNENRSVYRSDFLLDQDRAVRSANLARVYEDAGMTDVAFREAVEAVNSDYVNYSAHLFLANSYNALRDPRLVNLRYETAESTEYLLANVLAPVGAGVLSPTISQQEYSKLFERDRLGVTSLTEYLSRGAWLERGAQFGTFGNTSYSLDGFYHSDPGERPNNDLEQMQVALQFKQQFTPQDTAFVQASYLNAEAGDVAQRYDPGRASLTFRSKESQDGLVTLGYHHEWSPGVDTLFLAGYLPDRLLFSDQAFPTLAVDSGAALAYPLGMAQTYRGDAKVYFAEAQQLLRHNAHHLSIVGARFQWGDVETQSTQMNPTDFQPFFPPEGTPASAQNLTLDIERWSVYGYHQWEILDHLWLIGGVSYDHLEFPENFLYAPLSVNTRTEDRVLPKAGFIWSPFRDTTLRFGYTRSLAGATLEQSYRLEPAQVAGFAQAYRGIIPETAVGGPTPGAPFDTYGVSLEQKLKTGTYLGVAGEILDSTFTRTVGGYYIDTLNFLNGIPADIQQRLDYTEKSLVASVNQLLGRDWSFGVRYRVSQSDLKQQLTEVVNPYLPLTNPGDELNSVLQQLSLDTGFNHPSGIFARFNALWSRQSNRGYTPDQPGDNFWQLNALAGYRFAQRRAEVSVGLLNLTDQNYRLNPLTLYNELPHRRTLVARLLVNF